MEFVYLVILFIWIYNAHNSLSKCTNAVQFLYHVFFIIYQCLKLCHGFEKKGHLWSSSAQVLEVCINGFSFILFITNIEYGKYVPSHIFHHLKVTKFLILLQHGCGSINPFSVPHNHLSLHKPILCVGILALGCTKCATNAYGGMLNYW